MRLIMHLNSFAWPIPPAQTGPTLVSMAQAGEAAGFSAIAVMDHVWQHPWMGGAEGPVLECYATLSYLAAVTQRVGLLALATPASYRAPGLLAKVVTTLDVLSGGRAWLGVGAGDYEEEARGLGIPYPPQAERFELLEETLQVCLRMWSGEHGDDRPFLGQHVQLERALNLPQSISRPHPPILIAGGGEKKTLPLVARYGDACNLRPSPDIPQKLELLRALCAQEGRDFDAIDKTAAYIFDVGENGAGVPELLEKLRWLASLGVQSVCGRVVNDYRIDPIEIMGREVIPSIADL